MFDKEGFLLDLHMWTKDIAKNIASGENITLGTDHWDIIHLARQYYDTYDISPEMRPLVKWVGQNLGSDKGKSFYLLTLFPDSPAKLVSKIAGLPKPLNCI